MWCVHRSPGKTRTCGKPATRVPPSYFTAKHLPVAQGGWGGEAWCDLHAPPDSKPDPGPRSR